MRIYILWLIVYLTVLQPIWMTFEKQDLFLSYIALIVVVIISRGMVNIVVVNYISVRIAITHSTTPLLLLRRKLIILIYGLKTFIA